MQEMSDLAKHYTIIMLEPATPRNATLRLDKRKKQSPKRCKKIDETRCAKNTVDVTLQSLQCMIKSPKILARHSFCQHKTNKYNLT